MIGVKYIGALRDSSGYASSARSNLRGLLSSGEIDLTAGCVSFERQKTSHGDGDRLVTSLIDRQVSHKIQIVHLTPDNFISHRKPHGYNIGYAAWETDRLPDKWVDHCNSMNEIWVPSEWNVGVFSDSGVSVPIYCMPHIIPPPSSGSVDEEVAIGDKDTFVFYSIFQWIERKNPLCLLRAYLTEFEPDEPVALALKTYRLDTSEREQQLIRSDISAIKKSLRLPRTPPIIFFSKLMTYQEIEALHRRGDCFVLPHKAEGFGIPIAEAMIHSKPTIATNYSGNLTFMTKQNSYLIDYQDSPVYGMIFGNYHGYMNWAEPSIGHLKKLMREVYENRKAAQEKALLGKKTIEEGYNEQVIGRRMVNRLKEISKGL